jgi:hypothetical protein
LEGPIRDEDTKLPPGLKPPAHWSVKTDEQPEGAECTRELLRIRVRRTSENPQKAKFAEFHFHALR